MKVGNKVIFRLIDPNCLETADEFSKFIWEVDSFTGGNYDIALWYNLFGVEGEVLQIDDNAVIVKTKNYGNIITNSKLVRLIDIKTKFKITKDKILTKC